VNRLGATGSLQYLTECNKRTAGVGGKGVLRIVQIAGNDASACSLERLSSILPGVLQQRLDPQVPPTFASLFGLLTDRHCDGFSVPTAGTRGGRP
jgi:hypothetical protein